MRFASTTTVFSLIAAALLQWSVGSSSGRAPASKPLAFELQLQDLNVSPLTKLQTGSPAHLRVVFSNQQVVKLEDSTFVIEASTQQKLLQKILIDPQWIQDDKLEFRIELVEQGRFLDQVVARCAQISKALSEYNRSYQCTLPGETTPFLTYRLGQQGSVPPTVAMRQ